MINHEGQLTSTWLVLAAILLSLHSGSAWAEKCTSRPKLAIGNYHGLILAADCSLWVWGLGDEGVLGADKIEGTAYPIRVPHLNDVTAVSAGFVSSIAITQGGKVVVWGKHDLSPQSVSPLARDGRNNLQVVSGIATAISADWNAHGLLVLDKDGSVWLVRAGRSTRPEQAIPALVPGLRQIVSIAGTWQRNLALDENGNLWAWGWNRHGTPHDIAIESIETPVRVQGIPPLASIATGLWHVIALDRNGHVWVWGDNSHGSLGVPSNNANGPVKLTELTNIVAIDANYDRSVALDAGGNVYAWGGRWAVGASDRPVLRVGLEKIQAISAGGGSAGTHGTYGITNHGKIVVWRGTPGSLREGYAPKDIGKTIIVMSKDKEAPFNVFKPAQSN